MVKAIWKTITLILGAGAFLAVGYMSYKADNDFVWIAAKALGGFFITMIIMSQLEGLMNLVLGIKEELPVKKKEKEEDKKAA